MTLPDLLRPLLDDPASTCVLCDFDGTISDIVEDPADAVALPGALPALERLSGRAGCVAIISGRPVNWLADQLATIAHAPIELHGLYGLETWRNSAAVTVPEAVPWRTIIEGVAQAAEDAAPSTVLVERKGLSVGLHYRANPADEAWALAWASGQVADLGLKLLTGRLAIELRPPVERDKGDATTELLERHSPRGVVFLGDDTGDVPVALALRAYSARTAATGIVVCVDSEETPPAMRDVADLCVSGPGAAVALLTALADALDG